MFEEFKKGFGKAVGQVIGSVTGTIIVGVALGWLTKGKNEPTETESK